MDFTKFLEEFEAIREKYNITNVTIIATHIDNSKEITDIVSGGKTPHTLHTMIKEMAAKMASATMKLTGSYHHEVDNGIVKTSRPDEN